MSYIDTITSLYMIESDRACEEFDIAFESFYDSFFNNMVTESVSKPLGSSVKKFFVNIITALKNFLNKFKNFLTSSARDISYNITLSKLEKSLRKAKEEGKTKVTMPDYKAIRREYKDMCSDLRGYAKKFVKMKYDHISDIDNDLSKFMKKANEWDIRMNKVSDSKVTVSIDEALKFVEDERRGKTHILDSLNDTISQIDEMRHVAEETSKRVDILGSEIIPKHIGLLKRVSKKISDSVTKFISKVIFTNVLIFA